MEEFKNWNWVIISHLTIMSLGVNGSEYQRLSIQLLEDYIKCNNQDDDIYFGCPNSKMVQKQLDKIRQFNIVVDKYKLNIEQIEEVLYNPSSQLRVLFKDVIPVFL